jgi:hypothetical protein
MGQTAKNGVNALKRSLRAIVVGATLSCSLVVGGAAIAQDNSGTAKPPMTGSTKPHLGSGPAVQKSLPSSAPAATTKRTTGATNQSKSVKTMNSKAKAKVETEGK